MPEFIQASCPKCNKVFKAPTTLLGKKVKCKGCSQVIPVIEKQEDEEWTQNVKAYAVGANEDLAVVRCPFCANELESEAVVVCINCGYNLQTRQRMKTQVFNPITKMDVFVWLLPPIGCSLGALLAIFLIVSIWTGWPDLEPLYLGWMQTTEMGSVYMTVIFGFAAFACGSFAIKRFVFQPTPPMLEKGAVAVSSGDEEDD